MVLLLITNLLLLLSSLFVTTADKLPSGIASKRLQYKAQFSSDSSSTDDLLAFCFITECGNNRPCIQLCKSKGYLDGVCMSAHQMACCCYDMRDTCMGAVDKISEEGLAGSQMGCVAALATSSHLPRR
ncbi:hypothetical protein H6P81_006257 [Aristolochia fimbriata]|uniref:Uncharacterized protein n=1 Tax=Aristolochia fimbriata TaxID=158543 RepID=A0AAV7EX02_ARIFI|nr:hypothetical protein H6P81_006257 [Aristolochia fimbriata]